MTREEKDALRVLEVGMESIVQKGLIRCCSLEEAREVLVYYGDCLKFDTMRIQKGKEGGEFWFFSSPVGIALVNSGKVTAYIIAE